MSGSNYAYCDHCGTKAFYDADTEIGDAAIFHGKCLPAHDAAVTARAWDEGFTRGFYVGTLPQWGPDSDASEPTVFNPYEREGAES